MRISVDAPSPVVLVIVCSFGWEMGRRGRLSVDIDVNYVGAIEKEQMDAERPSLEDRIERLMARRATLHGA
ncbi:MAG: hypothetical protein ACXW3U_14905, partial [Rhodoplanes sp.]